MGSCRFLGHNLAAKDMTTVHYISVNLFSNYPLAHHLIQELYFHRLFS